MISYICADLKRIMKRLPRILVLILMYVVIVAIALILKQSEDVTSVNYVSTLSYYIKVLPIVLGVVELISVYADDFKAKTMQIAIGIGISRRRIILSKYIEMMICVCVDLVVFSLIQILMGVVTGMTLDFDQIIGLNNELFIVWLSICAYTSIAMILIFCMQGTGIATLLYLILSTTVLNRILGFLLESKSNYVFAVAKNHTLTNQLTLAKTRLILGNISVPALLSVLAFILVGFIITILLFRNRELEF